VSIEGTSLAPAGAFAVGRTRRLTRRRRRRPLRRAVACL